MSHFITGRKSGINNSPSQLITTSEIRADVGVQVYSPTTNSSNVWVGESGLTMDSADGTDGFPLTPGDSVLVPIRNPEDIWVTTSGTNQKLFFLIK